MKKMIGKLEQSFLEEESVNDMRSMVGRKTVAGHPWKPTR